MKTLTVQQLIDQLSEVENKQLPIFVFIANSAGEICFIQGIDNTLTDRIDINIDL